MFKRLDPHLRSLIGSTRLNLQAPEPYQSALNVLCKNVQLAAGADTSLIGNRARTTPKLVGD
jgi:hypothetical protein